MMRSAFRGRTGQRQFEAGLHETVRHDISRDSPVMTFSLRFSHEAAATNFPRKDSAFKIEGNGVLVITTDTTRVQFAPHAWVSVEDE